MGGDTFLKMPRIGQDKNSVPGDGFLSEIRDYAVIK